MISPLKEGLGKERREKEREREKKEEERKREGGGERFTYVFLSTSVNDWDLYQKLLDHLFSRHVKTTPDLHPILMSEAPVSQI